MARCDACPPASDTTAPWIVVWTDPFHDASATFAVCPRHAMKARANGATITPAEQETSS